LTYVLDLKRLWDDRLPITESQHQAAANVLLDPRQRVVSVIVAVQNNDLSFIPTLHSALSQLMVRELIVVNVAQSSVVDEALTEFAYQHPRTILVSKEGVSSLASAYNLGVKYASTPFLLFLDAHCLLPKDTVLHLLATGVQKPRPWVVGAASVKTQSGFVPMAPTFKKYFSKLTQNIVPEVSLAGGGHYAQVVPSQCILIPTPTFAELKGLDKRCYHTAFHWDLCLRVHEMGGSVFRAKEVVLVVHEPAIKGFGALLKQEWQSFQGWSHFYQKNFSKLTNSFSVLCFYMSLTRMSASSFCRKVLQHLGKYLPSVAVNTARNRGA